MADERRRQLSFNGEGIDLLQDPEQILDAVDRDPFQKQMRRSIPAATQAIGTECKYDERGIYQMYGSDAFVDGGIGCYLGINVHVLGACHHEGDGKHPEDADFFIDFISLRCGPSFPIGFWGMALRAANRLMGRGSRSFETI